MKTHCFLGMVILLLGLSFGANAHEPPSYSANGESHDRTTDFHNRVYAGAPHLHWHYGNGEAGGWDPCVAAAYDPDSQRYNLLPDGNCGEFSTNQINNGNINNNNINDINNLWC